MRKFSRALPEPHFKLWAGTYCEEIPDYIRNHVRIRWAPVSALRITMRADTLNPLRIFQVEKNAEDRELIAVHLTQGGLRCEFALVTTELEC